MRLVTEYLERAQGTGSSGKNQNFILRFEQFSVNAIKAQLFIRSISFHCLSSKFSSSHMAYFFLTTLLLRYPELRKMFPEQSAIRLCSRFIDIDNLVLIGLDDLSRLLFGCLLHKVAQLLPLSSERTPLIA